MEKVEMIKRAAAIRKAGKTPLRNGASHIMLEIEKGVFWAGGAYMTRAEMEHYVSKFQHIDGRPWVVIMCDPCDGPDVDPEDVPSSFDI